jgi:hypothetical protein
MVGLADRLQAPEAASRVECSLPGQAELTARLIFSTS